MDGRYRLMGELIVKKRRSNVNPGQRASKYRWVETAQRIDEAKGSQRDTRSWNTALDRDILAHLERSRPTFRDNIDYEEVIGEPRIRNAELTATSRSLMISTANVTTAHTRSLFA
ncbi:hypothetical protein Hypma_010972 [Hypsizygus marmoreus]|uniref:Uncharacterized protein n=1 Tax=Hypsizygus marmoreus TaxID=39966 RepID=A0A369JN48_HYPMA|nr:hypothetical protein Hypma_010972 [Hypsizygus marmoreus]